MKSLACIAAAATLGIAITMTLIQMQEPSPRKTESINVPPGERDDDPVRSELRRCQKLGAAGVDDARCLKAWAEMRSRFFRSSVAANPGLREDVALPAADTASDEAELADIPTIPPIEEGN
ncbi:putative entry exclusion protein TrbK-alt [Parasphingorhabdus sp.]|uniref:putative entry exclusion protein TrbK-alt n=1 Tax=Parasphingorhabdus sp. TaxID=2709688 RepID=UPI002F94160E